MSTRGGRRGRRQTWPMNTNTPTYRGYRFPPDVISHVGLVLPPILPELPRSCSPSGKAELRLVLTIAKAFSTHNIDCSAYDAGF
jgi:hypothetical protein